MPRPAKGPRKWFDESRNTWHIRDLAWKSAAVAHGQNEGARDAERALTRYRVEKEKAEDSQTTPSREIPPEGDSITSIVREYYAYKKRLVRSAETLRLNAENLILFFGGKRASDINAQVCREYGAWRAEPRLDANGIPRSAGASSVRRELGVLKAALTFAQEDGAISAAPKIRLPPENDPRERYLTRSEMARLLVATRKRRGKEDRSPAYDARHLARFILLGFYTGRRKSALLELSWNRVNLAEGTIDFRSGGRERSKKRRGWIVMPRKLRGHMRRWAKDGAAHVIHIEGRPVADVKTGFRAACKRAGITGATPHTLKHTAVSHAAMRKVRPRAAAIFFATTEETLTRVYEKHAPELLRDIADEMDGGG